jgi:hypothetical protein
MTREARHSALTERRYSAGILDSLRQFPSLSENVCLQNLSVARNVTALAHDLLRFCGALMLGWDHQTGNQLWTI